MNGTLVIKHDTFWQMRQKIATFLSSFDNSAFFIRFFVKIYWLRTEYIFVAKFKKWNFYVNKDNLFDFYRAEIESMY